MSICRSEGEIWASLCDHILRNTSLVALEVLSELVGKLLGLNLVFFMRRPAHDGAENFGVHTENAFRHLHTEAAHGVGLRHVE